MEGYAKAYIATLDVLGCQDNSIITQWTCMFIHVCYVWMQQALSLLACRVYESRSKVFSNGII